MAERAAGRFRQVTVLSADMVGYTPLAERLGEERLFELMRPYTATMVETVLANEGTIQDLAGDGVMALFGAPAAVEDSAMSACQAAIELQQRVSEMSRRLTRFEADLALRIGIHSGPVVVGYVGAEPRWELKAVGDTVNLAARLQTSAEPGRIVISDATRKLVEGRVRAEPLGERALKGKSAPHLVHRLDGVVAGVRPFDAKVARGLSAMVGRDDELKTLRALLDQAAGRVVVAHVTGAGGIGKSRLVHELAAGVASAKIRMLRCHCTRRDQPTPFFVFRHLLRELCKIDADAPQDRVRAAIAGLLEQTGLSLADHLTPLVEVMGLAGEGGGKVEETAGARIRRSLPALFEKLCGDTPVVILVDDLHWIDGSSEAALAAMVAWAEQRAPAAPRSLFLLCTFRPPYRPPWHARPAVSELALPPLGYDDSVSLASDRLGDGAAAELVELVVDKAEGNALFIEELADYLFDTGFAPAGPAASAAGGPIGGLPVSLDNLLMQRVDALSEPARALLETAAVIGRRFDSDLMARASPVGEGAGAALAELIRENLVFVDPAAGWPSCGIRHALIQDAVYASLLSARRATLHERVADLLEQRYARPDEEAPQLLAYHYGMAGRDDKSMRYHYFAGRKSLAVYALDDARDHFLKAMELVRAAPAGADDRLTADIVTGLSRVHFLSGDAAAMISQVRPYLHVVEAGGDQARTARCCYELGYAHFLAAQAAEAKAHTARAIDLGRACDDSDVLGHASISLALHKLYFEPPSREQRAAVRAIASEALAIAERTGNSFLGALALNALANEALTNGNPREQRRMAERLLAHARTHNEPFAEQAGELQLGYLDAFNNDPDSAIARADKALAHNLTPLVRMIVKSMKGGALALKGDGRAAYELLAETRAELVAKQCFFPLIGMDYQFGIAQILVGEMARGRQWIEQSIERFREWGYPPVFTALGHLMLGELYLGFVVPDRAQKPSPRIILKNLWFILRTVPRAAAKARRHLENAARYAREHDAPAYLAWALLDLGVLEAAKKNHAAAAGLLDEALSLAEAVDARETSRKARLALAGLPRAAAPSR